MALGDAPHDVMVNRRDFLLRSAAAAGLLAAAPSAALPRVRRSRLDRVGVALFTRHAFAFEATSILILVAMVGAVVLARKEQG